MSHVIVLTPDETVESRPLLGSRKRNNYISFAQGLWRHDCFPWLPARYVLAVMGFLAFVNVFLLQANLSMAIVQMVNDSSQENHYKAHSYKVYIRKREADQHLLRVLYCSFAFTKW